MSALPKPVQAQIDKANEIASQIYPKDAEGNPLSPEAAAELAAAGETVVNPEVDTPPQDVKPKVDTPPETPPVPEDKAEHRFKVLQGKYNAEVPRLQKELGASNELVSELRQRVNNTESLLATMQAVAPAAAPAAPAPTQLPGITDEETAQFGPDLIDVIKRVAEHTIMPQVDSRVAPLQTSVDAATQSASHAAHTVAVSDREKTIQTLAAAVPEWETQNEQPEFLAWLNDKDAYAGVPRGQLLTDAFRANDAGRVIAFFKGFQTEHAVVTPTDPTPPVVEPQVQLDQLTAPGTPKTGTTSTPNEIGKRQWSRNDISALYAQKNEYVKKGTPIPDELQKLEIDLIAAQREGRIR